MKNFLNRVKRNVKVVAWYTLGITIVVALFALGCIYAVGEYIVNKVRGAFSWIADKYNAVVNRFTSTAAE